ncbi:MAG: bifunctional transcriptional activator/DNA repair enzyme AdaA [bacterium]|jgi:AraC family transcriptional regulator of adaptative response/methylated-DNA-[protein]-cysteine methyltransferase
MIDSALWERAWAERDPAFDGRFFVCVRTTGVYCRCTCPVRLPFRRNVHFVPSAAAAEAAGFRPCLRCRPETTPFSAAWNGTLASVTRAFRLIVEDGALDGDDSTVEALASRLGMTERHLRRLFARHLGASPTAVARTARVQRAKRLLTDTDLPMTEIAMTAGFGSLRRFNAAFADVYGRAPSAMRRRSQKQ